MKINITLDTTPDELRAFFGLPDVQALQAEILEKVREQIRAGVEGADPLSMMRPFIAPNLQSMEAMQRAFWNGISAAGLRRYEVEGLNVPYPARPALRRRGVPAEPLRPAPIFVPARNAPPAAFRIHLPNGVIVGVPTTPDRHISSIRRLRVRLRRYRPR